MKSERERMARGARRKLTALASIGLALAAGAFLACTRRADEKGAEAGGEGGFAGQAQAGASASAASASASAAVSGGDPADGGVDGGGDGGVDGGAADGGAPDGGKRDAGAGGRPGAIVKPGVVDRKEHRRGMPVRDNYAE